MALLLVFLVAAAWSPMARAQSACTITQVTDTVGDINFDPSMNAAGSRIVFTSTGDLTPNSPGNGDGN
ncbi:MAG: hypothetical protein ACREJ6_03465, partial [Candidatus Methylomirabilis sp.]